MTTEIRSFGYWRAIMMGSASLLALASAPNALAQQATAAATPPAKDQVEEIVVTGFRASLQSALDSKRKSDQVVESVVAEDLGKMPDQNVAESLQRLPGIQIDRAGGHGTAVLIDGLRQNLITLNGDIFLTGKEFYVSGEASGGGAGSNAQLSSLEGVPSELIGGIDVFKNPLASQTEGGLGGIIDLKTRSALAQPDGLSLGGNLRGTKAQDAEGGLTPNATLVAGYKFSPDFALTGSVSYDDEKTHTKEFQDQNRNQWLITNSAQGPYTGSPTAGTLSTLPGGKYYIIPQLAYFSDILDQTKTKGASLGAEWNWKDGVKSRFNWFYSKEEDESFTYTNKAWFNGQGTPPGSLLPSIDPSQAYAIDANGVVQNATFNANGAETATLYQSSNAQANNYQFVTSFDNGGRLRGSLDAAYAKASSDSQFAQADVEHGLYFAGGAGLPSVATSPAAPGCNNGGASCTDGNHGYQFNWSNGGSSGLPTVNYPTDVLSNPAYTTFKSNWAWANLTDNKQFSLKGDIKYDPTVTQDLTLSAGLRYAGRDVEQTFGRYLIDGSTLGRGGVAAGPSACCRSDGDPTTTPPTPQQSGNWIYYSDPGYATIPYSTAASNPALVKYYNNFASGTIAVKDPVAGGMTNPSTYLNTLWAQAGVPNNSEKFFVDTLSSFKVIERTTTLYLMGDLGAPADHYHANFGVRVVNTNLTVDNGQQAPVPTWYGTASWNGVNSNNIAVEHKRNYVDVLPTLNFTLDVSDTQKVRLAAARVVSPQNLFQLGVGNSYNFTRQTRAGKDGFAFANGSSGNPELDPYRASQFLLNYENYFAAGALVSAGVFYKSVDNFVETQNIPTLVNDDFGGTVGNVNQPVNAGKGKIYGVELGGQYAFPSGFGVAANYTRSNSTSDQKTAFSTGLSIPGVSKDSINATVYYEHSGFAARASYSWRSSAVNDSLVGATFSFPDQTGTQKVYGVFSAPYGQVDGQVSYDFSSHFGVLASAQNLTDAKQHTYLQWDNLPFTYDDTGRRYFIGIKAKL